MSTDKPIAADSKSGTGCWIILACFCALAFYGWYSGGWERGYERDRLKQERRNYQTLESLKRASKMSPEEYQRALDDAYRDAPVGRTRGGDTY